MLKEIEKFYSNLYKADSAVSSENSRNTFLENPDIPRLTADNAEACEGKLSVAECFKCLQTFENNKSPGDDGLTVEFYKAFWNTLGSLLVDSFITPTIMVNCRTPRSELLSHLLRKKIRTGGIYPIGDPYLLLTLM